MALATNTPDSRVAGPDLALQTPIDNIAGNGTSCYSCTKRDIDNLKNYFSTQNEIIAQGDCKKLNDVCKAKNTSIVRVLV